MRGYFDVPGIFKHGKYSKRSRIGFELAYQVQETPSAVTLGNTMMGQLLRYHVLRRKGYPRLGTCCSSTGPLAHGRRKPYAVEGWDKNEAVPLKRHVGSGDVVTRK